MHVKINWALTLAFVAALIFIYLSGRIIVKQPKRVLGYVFNGIMGVIMLILLSEILEFSGVYLPVSGVTLALSGLLGAPGVILSVLICCVL